MEDTQQNGVRKVVQSEYGSDISWVVFGGKEHIRVTQGETSVLFLLQDVQAAYVLFSALRKVEDIDATKSETEQKGV